MGTWEVIQAIFLFGLVLVLAWWTTRFVSIRHGAAGGRGRSLRVLEHVPAGRDRSILLLEVGGKVYLVGATAQQINLLDAIEDHAAIARIMENAPQVPENPLQAIVPINFKDVLSRVGVKLPTAPAPEQAATQAEPSPDEEPTADRLKHQLERLRRLQQNQEEERP